MSPTRAGTVVGRSRVPTLLAQPARTMYTANWHILAFCRTSLRCGPGPRLAFQARQYPRKVFESRYRSRRFLAIRLSDMGTPLHGGNPAQTLRGTMLRKVFRTLFVLALTSPVARASAAACGDAINLSQAIVYNSPADIASWPVTHKITQLTMEPTAGQNPGLSFQSSARSTWPDYTPPGWDGPIQYTVWAVVNVNGQWYMSGIIQMWRQRASTGAPLLTDFARNWVYDGRWGPMQGHQPVVGEQMGFFLSAGNARGEGGVTSVRERTNVVMVSVPANDTGVFTFSNALKPTAMDFDGDCRAEIGVYRPSTGEWRGLASSSNYTTTGVTKWGNSTDMPVPGDYDGDGQTDIAVFRPSTGSWGILFSSTNYSPASYASYQWGTSGDIPVPGDYDGDGRTDIAVFRPSTGMWGILLVDHQLHQVGLRSVGGEWRHARAGRLRRRRQDRSRLCIGRLPASGASCCRPPTTRRRAPPSGGRAATSPVPGDYDGDGKTDLAVYRPSTGVWCILLSSTNFTKFGSAQWGLRPTPRCLPTTTVMARLTWLSSARPRGSGTSCCPAAISPCRTCTRLAPPLICRWQSNRNWQPQDTSRRPI